MPSKHVLPSSPIQDLRNKKETFSQEKTSSNIPEFSSISSKSQTPPTNPKGFQTTFKSVEPTVFQGFEPKNDEFGGFESADTMPKVKVLEFQFLKKNLLFEKLLYERICKI